MKIRFGLFSKNPIYDFQNFYGHSFAGAVKYVVEDERRAVVLEAVGVTQHDWRKMTDDFVRQAGFNPDKTKACCQAILSFAPEDKIDNKTMQEIAVKYWVEMGFSNTQFAIVKHIDKDHRHIHLLGNLVDNNGKSIKDLFMGLKRKKITQKTDERIWPHSSYKKRPEQDPHP